MFGFPCLRRFVFVVDVVAVVALHLFVAMFFSCVSDLCCVWCLFCFMPIGLCGFVVLCCVAILSRGTSPDFI